MFERRQIEAQIEKLIEQAKGLKVDVPYMNMIYDISMNKWEWETGVALFALYLYYKETGDTKILDYLTEWFEKKFKEGLPSQNINTTCPMLTLTFLYEETKNPRYLEVLKEWLDYALKDLPRTPEGGFQHIVTGHDNRLQLWDDTLYMTVLFIARMGVILKQNNYIQESIRQFLVHIKYLSDVKTGLFFHGWTFENNNHFAHALWARGNAWYTAGLCDYLDMVNVGDGVQMFLLSTLERQVKALEKLQHTSGLWHTLLDDSSSYLETSASAGFAYGILKSIRKGYISEQYRPMAEKAVAAVISQIDENGVVLGVSFGTGMGRTLDEYREIPICPMPYGQSLAVLMLVEWLKHI